MNDPCGHAPFTEHTDSWKIAFFGDYFAKFEGPRIKASFPKFDGDFGGSLWLERR